MKDGANWIVGIVILFGILLALGLNLALFPYLLMIALGALGYEVSFWVALAFWVLVTFILNYIKNLFKK